jgi:hypothetical protein
MDIFKSIRMVHGLILNIGQIMIMGIMFKRVEVGISIKGIPIDMYPMRMYITMVLC